MDRPFIVVCIAKASAIYALSFLCSMSRNSRMRWGLGPEPLDRFCVSHEEVKRLVVHSSYENASVVLAALCQSNGFRVFSVASCNGG